MRPPITGFLPNNVPIEFFAGPHDAARLSKQLEGAAWIVDSLLGTGARVTSPALDARVIDQLNRPRRRRNWASSICPAGWNWRRHGPVPAIAHDSRRRNLYVRPRPKDGLVGVRGGALRRRLHVLDIGVPRKLIERIAAESGDTRRPSA